MMARPSANLEMPRVGVGCIMLSVRHASGRDQTELGPSLQGWLSGFDLAPSAYSRA